MSNFSVHSTFHAQYSVPPFKIKVLFNMSQVKFGHLVWNSFALFWNSPSYLSIVKQSFLFLSFSRLNNHGRFVFFWLVGGGHMKGVIWRGFINDFTCWCNAGFFVFESHVRCLKDLQIQFAFLCEQNGASTWGCHYSDLSFSQDFSH